MRVARLILLDSGPVGLACAPSKSPDVRRCRAWLDDLEAGRVEVLVPGIVDYEVRRELNRIGSRRGLDVLDHLSVRFRYLPISRRALDRAAELWALVRRAGRPTADPHALDADCILAGQADTVGGPGDIAIIATRNLRHLTLFPKIDAQDWVHIS